jgi:hypothetical protein
MPFHVGFMVEKVALKEVCLSSPPVLTSVPTISPYPSALLFVCHRRHIILAGVSVTDTLKIIKMYCVRPITNLPLFLSFLLANVCSVLLHVQ